VEETPTLIPPPIAIPMTGNCKAPSGETYDCAQGVRFSRQGKRGAFVATVTIARKRAGRAWPGPYDKTDDDGERMRR